MKKIILVLTGILFSLAVDAEELGRIKILTYNVFGVLIAPNRKARMEKIGEEIAKLDPDIIGFQEAFESRHRKVLLESLERAGWTKPFQYYEKKWYGPGAWIVSKFPIEKTEMHFYPVNGSILDSDYYGKKAIAYAQVNTPYGPLDFFCTHLIARYTSNYDRKGNLKENDWLKIDRLLQVEQVSRFIQQKNQESQNRSLVAVGDFNSPPILLEYQLLIALSGLKNVIDETGIENCGGKQRDCMPSERIDHIFYQNYYAPKGFYLKPIRTELLFSEKIKTKYGKLKLSDHNGLLTEFAVLSSEDPSPKIANRVQAKISLLQEQISPEEFSRLQKELEKPQPEFKDPLWEVLGVKALEQANQWQLRNEPALISLSKLVCAREQTSLDLKEIQKLKTFLEKKGKGLVSEQF